MASCLSWKCQNQLLQYCRLYNPETEQALLNHPLNNLALQVTLNKNSNKDDAPFVQYLHTYVTGVKIYRLVTRRSYARAICRDPVSTILTTIAEQLVTGNWPVHSLHSQIISMICTVGGDIPVQTINKLKMKLPRH